MEWSENTGRRQRELRFLRSTFSSRAGPRSSTSIDFNPLSRSPKLFLDTSPSFSTNCRFAARLKFKDGAIRGKRAKNASMKSAEKNADECVGSEQV